MDRAFPVALAAAQRRLGTILPQEAEDVAIQAVAALVKKVGEIESVDECLPLVSTIARFKAWAVYDNSAGSPLLLESGPCNPNTQPGT